MTRRVALAVTTALLLCASAALGQSEKASTLPLDRFRTPIDRSGFAVTEGGGIPGHLGVEGGLILDYSLNPLVVRDGDGRVASALVQNRVGANALITLGLFEYVSLGLDVPLLLFQNAGDLSEFQGAPGLGAGLAAMGMGDLRLVPKIRILREDRHFVNLALIAAVSLPTALGFNFSDGFGLDYGTSYLGEGPGAFAILPELAVSANPFGARVALNLGYRLRPPISYSTPAGPVSVDPEIAYRLGVGYDIAELPAAAQQLGGADLPALPSVLVFAELYGATSDRNPFGLLRESTPIGQQQAALSNALEWNLGARWALPVADLHLEGGLGSGLLSGFGSPDLRVFAGLRWAPVQQDRDEDGIADADDACPDAPEDADGFEDSDGCPDPDNDRDGIPDAEDKCPNEAEDVDGFEDTDGCPDLDNDGDGIADIDDKCPEQDGPVDNEGCPVRDRDLDGITDEEDECPDEPGPADRQGCPVVDSDGDGIPDDEDECPDAKGPLEREGCPLNDRDKDGVLDEEDECPDAAGPAMFKGCPDTDGDGIPDAEDQCPEAAGLGMFKGCADTDKDGIPDPVDECPEEPETINGFEDEDGCPDKGKTLVVVTRDKIEIEETVYFQTGSSRIQPRSFNLLNQVASVLKANSQIEKVRIEGHTDSVGNDALNKRLSQSRAESVRKYLEERGIEPAQLDALGYGEEQPIAPNDSAAGRAKNRRVEFVIVDQ